MSILKNLALLWWHLDGRAFQRDSPSNLLWDSPPLFLTCLYIAKGKGPQSIRYSSSWMQTSIFPFMSTGRTSVTAAPQKWLWECWPSEEIHFSHLNMPSNKMRIFFLKRILLFFLYPSHFKMLFKFNVNWLKKLLVQASPWEGLILLVSGWEF